MSHVLAHPEARNARRTPDDLATRVRLSLDRFPLRDVAIDADGPTVTLRGSVASYYEKQMAQEFARRVAGVIRVVNSLRVQRDASALPANDVEPVPLSA
jgi:osmotically-inducible protein OsmY